MAQYYNPSTQDFSQQRQEDLRKFQTSLGYMVSLVPAWTTEQHPVSKNTYNKTLRNKIQILCKMFFNWGLSDISLTISLGLYILERDNYRDGVPVLLFQIKDG